MFKTQTTPLVRLTEHFGKERIGYVPKSTTFEHVPKVTPNRGFEEEFLTVGSSRSSILPKREAHVPGELDHIHFDHSTQWVGDFLGTESGVPSHVEFSLEERFEFVYNYYQNNQSFQDYFNDNHFREAELIEKIKTTKHFKNIWVRQHIAELAWFNAQNHKERYLIDQLGDLEFLQLISSSRAIEPLKPHLIRCWKKGPYHYPTKQVKDYPSEFLTLNGFNEPHFAIGYENAIKSKKSVYDFQRDLLDHLSKLNKKGSQIMNAEILGWISCYVDREKEPHMLLEIRDILFQRMNLELNGILVERDTFQELLEIFREQFDEFYRNQFKNEILQARTHKIDPIEEFEKAKNATLKMYDFDQLAGSNTSEAVFLFLKYMALDEIEQRIDIDIESAKENYQILREINDPKTLFHFVRKLYGYGLQFDLPSDENNDDYCELWTLLEENGIDEKNLLEVCGSYRELEDSVKKLGYEIRGRGDNGIYELIRQQIISYLWSQASDTIPFEPFKIEHYRLFERMMATDENEELFRMLKEVRGYSLDVRASRAFWKDYSNMSEEEKLKSLTNIKSMYVSEKFDLEKIKNQVLKERFGKIERKPFPVKSVL